MQPRARVSDNDVLTRKHDSLAVKGARIGRLREIELRQHASRARICVNGKHRRAPLPLNQFHRCGPSRIHLHGTKVAAGRDEVDAPDANKTRQSGNCVDQRVRCSGHVSAGRSIQNVAAVSESCDAEGALANQLPRYTERDTASACRRRTRQSLVRLRRIPAGNGRVSPSHPRRHSLTPCPPPDVRGLISHCSTPLAPRICPDSDVTSTRRANAVLVRRPRQAAAGPSHGARPRMGCPRARVRQPVHPPPVDGSRGSRDRRPRHSVDPRCRGNDRLGREWSSEVPRQRQRAHRRVLVDVGVRVQGDHVEASPCRRLRGRARGHPDDQDVHGGHSIPKRWRAVSWEIT